MFADPQSITVSAVAKSLPCIARNETTSQYWEAVGQYKLTIGHQFRAERSRFTVRVDDTKTAADPLASANNRIYSQSAYIVIDKPNVGYTAAEAQALATALAAWATPANLLKVLGGET
jgi:hypothetical protein